MTGVRVRNLIAQAGRTHSSIADEIGLAPHKLSKSLSGARAFRDSEIDELAKALRVSRDHLLNDDIEPAGGYVHPFHPRDRMLEAAAELIATQGFHVVRIADIARACDVSTGTVHYYFPTRDDVLTAALRYYAERMFARLEVALRQLVDDPEGQINLLIDSQLPVDPAVRDEWSVWIQFWTEALLVPALRPAHNDLYQRWRGLVRSVVDNAVSAGVVVGRDPQLVALRFTTVVDGAAIQLLTGAPGIDAALMRSLLSEVFWP